MLAIPQKDVSYNYAAGHLKSFLEEGGYSIEIRKVETAIEANRLVAEGKADLTFILNHSLFIPQTLHDHGAKLRTIAPLFRRLLFLFTKNGETEGPVRNIFTNKTVKLEVLEGETHRNLMQMLNEAALDSVNYSDSGPGDLYHFWGTYYGQRARDLFANGWESISLNEDWIQFLLLNNPALEEFVLPGIPGIDNEHLLRTVATETLLVGSSRLGENTVHDLAQYLYHNKLRMLGYDRMYNSIDEHFNAEELLYPLHEGTDAYLRRDEPTFLEKYSDALALFISVLAIFYGAAQAIQSKIARRKKDQVDTYFIEFLTIKENHFEDRTKSEEQYDALFHKVLIQMTDEKLDKTDFHILSRLIQQELTNLKMS
ncbi:MAG: hypothetical protein AAGG59_01830 [Bacteroidota bacterium]